MVTCVPYQTHICPPKYPNIIATCGANLETHTHIIIIILLFYTHNIKKCHHCDDTQQVQIQHIPCQARYRPQATTRLSVVATMTQACPRRDGRLPPSGYCPGQEAACPQSSGRLPLVTWCVNSHHTCSTLIANMIQHSKPMQLDMFCNRT